MKIILANDTDHQKALEQTGFWGKQAAGCLPVARSTGRYLFAHRSRYVLEPNTWGFWGGAIDESETPMQAVRRELKEEAGFHGQYKLILLDIFSHQSGFKYYSYMAIVEEEFEPKLDRETQGFAWVEYGQWPQPLHPGVKRTLSAPSNLYFVRDVLK